MSSRPFDVYIKTMTGKTIMLMVSSSDTVMQLKKKIQDKEGVGTSEQRLLYSGKQLEDERTIGDYAIPRESTLFLIVRLNEVTPQKLTAPKPPAQLDVYWLAPESLTKQYFYRVRQSAVTTVHVFVWPFKRVFRFLMYFWKIIIFPPLKALWNVLTKILYWLDTIVLVRVGRVIKFVFKTIYNILRPLVLTWKGVIRDSFKGLYRLLKFVFKIINNILIQPLWKLTKAIWNNTSVPLWKGIKYVCSKTSDALDYLGGKSVDGIVWLYNHTLLYVFKGISTLGTDFLWPSIKYVARSIDRFSSWLDLDGKAAALLNNISNFLYNTVFSKIYNASAWIFRKIYNTVSWVFSKIYDASAWIFRKFYDASSWMCRKLYNAGSWVYRCLLKPVLLDPSYWLLRKTGSAISWTTSQVKKAVVWSAKQTHKYLLLPTWRVLEKSTNVVWTYTLLPLFKFMDRIVDGYIYPFFFQPVQRVVIRSYTVMYEKVKKWFAWGLETNGFVVGVSHGTTLATRSHDMIVAMPHNTTYSIWVYNGQAYAMYCKITIDNQIDVGLFWLNPKISFKIERCASSKLKFLFVKDPQQTSESISQSKLDSRLDEVFVQLKERNKGVITIQWLHPGGYGVPQMSSPPVPSQAATSARSSLVAEDNNSNNTNNNNARDGEAEGGPAFGFGSTVLSGHSNQHMQKLQGHFANVKPILTQTIYLVAPLGGKEKTD